MLMHAECLVSFPKFDHPLIKEQTWIQGERAVRREIAATASHLCVTGVQRKRIVDPVPWAEEGVYRVQMDFEVEVESTT